MNNFKIALIGGPCGGKTESLEFLSKELIDRNYSVDIVDETANSLLKLGYMPSNNISTFDFQNLLFKIQFLKEYISEKKYKITLCDRGMFDGKAYIDNEQFKKILNLNKVNENDLFLTYDGALYFRSIAYEFPEEFSKWRIYETPEIGKTRDELCKEIWKDIIIPSEYDNSNGLEFKQKMIFSSLKELLKILKDKQTYSLCDYYDFEHFKYIHSGIDEILEKNNISQDICVKTKELIK